MNSANTARIRACPNWRATTCVISGHIICSALPPLIYLVTPAKHTVTQGLKNFCSGPYAGTDYHYLFAALCTVSIPIIVIFLMFQNLFISGITAGSVKE